ncbi:MAG: aminodeoxychorismate synthase component I [Gallionella sp.]|nr:aminodeoxychorismate synthase component I [Gallionella sp.]MDD4959947.1 aminodeoxychorismate synthase component I [Gallionella sp.]
MTYLVELPYRTDATYYFAALVDLPWAAWLDSAGLGRYDILTAAPVHTMRLDHTHADPFGALRQALGAPLLPQADIPFAGGALGYWGYDLSLAPDTEPTDAALPDMAVGIYDWAVVVDHQQQRARLVSRLRFAETAAQLPMILARLRHPPPLPLSTFQVQGEVSSNFTRASYATAFARIQYYLHAGDCYQINLAQRFSVPATGCAFAAYRDLRQRSPAPYSAFLNFPDVQILCASPERFLQVTAGKVETKPIKGTRPRGTTPLQDQQLREVLRNHPKDRAENVMIVDLLRNDLSQSCTAVRVPNLFEIESFAHVHHLVSTVTGELREGCDALDVLRDCFPGGSITGAPKQRAMQIIAELEPHRRGVYCGAIGYVGFDGNMDTNIVIRTLVYSQGEIACCAGGGIVADSEVEAEYQETLDKAGAMLDLLQCHQSSVSKATRIA